MSTTLTPPPVSAGEVPPPTPSSGGAAKVIAILTMALGGAVILATVTGSAISTVAAASVSTSARTLAVSGVDELDVDVAAGSLRIEFADVDEAELEVTAAFGATPWTLERDGDTLVVASPQWQFGGPWMFGGRSGDAVLLLPTGLEGLDASFGLGAGELIAEGEFGELELDLGAGRAELAGTADSLEADVSAGRADLDLSGVRTAELSVSAGALEGELSGAQPDELILDVSAGSLDLIVPEGDYDVRSDVSAGEFDNGIGSVPGADSTITVTVSAGQAVLRAG